VKISISTVGALPKNSPNKGPEHYRDDIHVGATTVTTTIRFSKHYISSSTPRPLGHKVSAKNKCTCEFNRIQPLLDYRLSMCREKGVKSVLNASCLSKSPSKLRHIWSCQLDGRNEISARSILVPNDDVII
jgi:hypothetical protein